MSEAVTTGSPQREPEALGQIREGAQALLAEGRQEEACEYMLAALDAVLRKNRDLELLLEKLRRQGAGKSSERVDPAQLSLLFEELCSQQQEPEVDPEREAQEDAALTKELEAAEAAEGGKKARKPRGLKTRDVERQVHQVEVPAQERTCPECGQAKQRIGEDVSRVLEYMPAHFVEHEYRREKLACGTCKEGVTTAPGPSKVIDRSPVGASLLAHVVVSKYADHCPLHRLQRIYVRDGATIPVSTLSDWAAEAADLLSPVTDRLAERVLGAYVVRTDATGLKVLDPESPANIKRGTLWCYVGDDRDVVFCYAPTGEGVNGPWVFLKDRAGYVQADASNVFDRLFNGEVADAVEVACWAHARRKLVDLQDTDCRIAFPLKLIARMYRIERLANLKKLSPENRTSLRQNRSQPILDKLKRWLVATAAKEPPGTALAKAVAYQINHWEALTRFVKDGRLSPDNNICEQQMRDIALGRKNYLFAGSHAAASRTAVLYSLTRTCAQHGVPPLPYFTDVLTKLSQGWKQSRLDELLPDRWLALHADHAKK